MNCCRCSTQYHSRPAARDRVHDHRSAAVRLLHVGRRRCRGLWRRDLPKMSAMDRRSRFAAGVGLLVVVMGVPLSACGTTARTAGSTTLSSGTSSPTTTAAPTGSSLAPPVKLIGAFRLSFADTATPTRCPRRSAAGAECYLLTASTDGDRIRLGPTPDAEVPAGSPDCGATAIYRTRLTTPIGYISILERGPRLCLGALGAVPRTFDVTGGTGRYRHAGGGGTIAFDVQAVGATEVWAGRITVPNH